MGSGHQQAVPLLGQVTVAVPFGVSKGRNVILLKVGIILLYMIRLVEWPTFEFGPKRVPRIVHVPLQIVGLAPSNMLESMWHLWDYNCVRLLGLVV